MAAARKVAKGRVVKNQEEAFEAIKRLRNWTDAAFGSRHLFSVRTVNGGAFNLVASDQPVCFIGSKALEVWRLDSIAIGRFLDVGLLSELARFTS
jgi:hypothetical protein